MNLNSLFFGIFLPKILVNCGAPLDYFYARFASLGVVVSFLSHIHWPDTPGVPRLISLQISCLTFLPTSCEFLTNQGKRRRSRPLDRRVRPEGQKGAPSLEDVRGPRKTTGPRKRRTAARRIAGGACCASAGGPKGLKAFGTGRSAGTGGCAHKAGDGPNV